MPDPTQLLDSDSFESFDLLYERYKRQEREQEESRNIALANEAVAMLPSTEQGTGEGSLPPLPPPGPGSHGGQLPSLDVSVDPEADGPGILTSILQGALAGPEDAIANTMKSLGVPEGAPWMTVTPFTDQAEESGATSTLAGGLAKGATQALTGFIPAMKALRVAGLGAGFLGASAAGGISDFYVFDPLEARASNLLRDTLGVSTPLTDWLATNPDDAPLTGRLKNTLEGFGLGFAAEGLIRVVRYARRGIRARLARAAAEGQVGVDTAVEASSSASQVVDAAHRLEELEAAKTRVRATLEESTPVSGGVDAVDAAEQAPTAELPAALRRDLGEMAGDGGTLDIEFSKAEKDLALAEQQLELNLGRLPKPLAKEIADGVDEAVPPSMAERMAEGRQRRRTVVDGIEDRLGVQPVQTRVFADAVAHGRPLDELLDVYDHTNHDRIYSTEHLKHQLSSLAKLFSSNPKTFRELGVETFENTESKAAKYLLKDEADKIGAPPEMIQMVLDQLMPGVEDLAAKITSIRFYEMSLAREIDGVARGLDMLGGTVTDLAMEAKFVRLVKQLANVNDARAGIVTEIARGQSALRIMAKGSDFNSEAIEGIRKAIAEQGGSGNIRKLARQWQTVSNSGTKARRRFGAHLKSPGRLAQDMLVEYWLNSILSGPITQTVNVLSNTITGLYLPAETVLEGALTFDTPLMREGIEMYMGLGKGFKATLNLVAVTGDLKPAVASLASGKFRQGWKGIGDALEHSSVGRALKTGQLQTVGEGSRQFDIPFDRAITGQKASELTRKTAAKFGVNAEQAVANNPRLAFLESHAARMVDRIGGIVNLPSRALTTTDELAKGLSYHMMAHRLAFREGRRLGLRGGALDEFIDRAVDEAPTWHISKQGIDERKILNPTSVSEEEIKRNTFLRELDDASQEHARVATFTDALDTASLSKTVQDALAKHPTLRLIVPFVRTPVNILKFVGQRAPFGAAVPFDKLGGHALLGTAVRQSLYGEGATQASRRAAIARMTAGTAIWMAAVEMAQKGYITGSGPTNRQERSNLEELTGWQGDSLVLRDAEGNAHYRSFNRLDPFGLIFGMAATYSEITGSLDAQERDDLAAAMVVALMENLKAKSYLTGITSALRALDDPDRYADAWIKRHAGSFVPTFFGQADRGLGGSRDIPDIRQEPNSGMLGKIESWLEQARTRAGGDPKYPRRNAFGEVVTYPHGYGPDIISPIFEMRSDPSPIAHEIARLSERGEGLRIDPHRMWSFIGAGETAVELNAEQRDLFARLATGGQLNGGRTIRQELEDLIVTDRYLNKSDGGTEQGFKGGRILKLEEVWADRRERAEREMLKRYPGIKSQLDTLERAQRKARKADNQKLLESAGLSAFSR